MLKSLSKLPLIHYYSMRLHAFGHGQLLFITVSLFGMRVDEYYFLTF